MHERGNVTFALQLARTVDGGTVTEVEATFPCSCGVVLAASGDSEDDATQSVTQEWIRHLSDKDPAAARSAARSSTIELNGAWFGQIEVRARGGLSLAWRCRHFHRTQAEANVCAFDELSKLLKH